MLRLRFSSFTSGNDQDVTNEMTANWRETTLPTMLFYYNPRNIYNSDKFGLFYRVLSTKVMHLEDKKRVTEVVIVTFSWLGLLQLTRVDKNP